MPHSLQQLIFGLLFHKHIEDIPGSGQADIEQVLFDSRKGELKQEGFIAWLERYRWMKEDLEHVIVWCISPDEISTKEYLDKVKSHITENIQNKKVFGTEELKNLFIWPNA